MVSMKLKVDVTHVGVERHVAFSLNLLGEYLYTFSKTHREYTLYIWFIVVWYP